MTTTWRVTRLSCQLWVCRRHVKVMLSQGLTVHQRHLDSSLHSLGEKQDLGVAAGTERGTCQGACVALASAGLVWAFLTQESAMPQNRRHYLFIVEGSKIGSKYVAQASPEIVLLRLSLPSAKIPGICLHMGLKIWNFLLVHLTS